MSSGPFSHDAVHFSSLFLLNQILLIRLKKRNRCYFKFILSQMTIVAQLRFYTENPFST